MKIGIVDLDTSHPANWIPIERELGHEIVGVYDGGSIHPPDYVKRFAAEHKIPRVFDSLDAMVEQVDCAIIHGCDWDTHVAKARPFIDAGKSVLVDKPVAGNLKDLRQFRAWAEKGARISGGSSLRFCVETRQWLARPIEERGTPHTVVCGCGVDEFNYGIHAYSMLSGILGGGAVAVRDLGAGVQRRVMIDYPDGRRGMVIVGQTAAWLPFYTTIVTDKGVTQYTADASQLYRALLQSVLPFLARETDQSPLTPNAWLEPELCALAAKASWESGRPVKISELNDSIAYDGKAFAESYRLAKYQAGK